MVSQMRGAPTRRGRRETVTPATLMLVVAGFLALTFIVMLPAEADARYLDGAGTASLENSPVTPVEPASQGDGQSAAGQGASTSTV